MTPGDQLGIKEQENYELVVLKFITKINYHNLLLEKHDVIYSLPFVMLGCDNNFIYMII